MDRQHWILLRPLIRRAVRLAGRSRRVAFGDELILTMYLWAVAHDRPMCWACDKSHYHEPFRPRRLPSVSQFCRRVKTELFQRQLQALHDLLSRDRRLAGINFLDGLPLPVGNFSRDPDARRGWGVGRVEKGYKLHALATQDRFVAGWSVAPLNVHEMHVAGRLIGQATPVPAGAVFLADGNYDAHDLHKHVAGHGGWLWARPRGMARHDVTLRQMGPARRALLDVWRQTPGFARALQLKRVHIEGIFSNLTACGGGLGPLPRFVRRLERVRRWVGGKIILYHTRLTLRQAANIQ